MTYLFRKFRAFRRSSLFRRIARRSYWSEQDGCRLVSMKCVECGGRYEERLHVAKLKVIKGGVFDCLSCDEKGGRIRDIRAVLFTFEII